MEEWCAKKGFAVLGWREVPTDNSTIGPSALACEPVVRQVREGESGSFFTESTMFSSSEKLRNEFLLDFEHFSFLLRMLFAQSDFTHFLSTIKLNFKQ